MVGATDGANAGLILVDTAWAIDEATDAGPEFGASAGSSGGEDHAVDVAQRNNFDTANWANLFAAVGHGGPP